MSDYFTMMNFYPYNMYQNYGYFYPPFNNCFSQPVMNSQMYNFNTTNNTPTTDKVSFKSNKQTQPTTKNEGLSTGAKIAISLGVAATLAIGADFLFCKGKHIKSIFENFKSKPKEPSTTPNTNPTLSSSVTQPSASVNNPITSTKNVSITNLREHLIGNLSTNPSQRALYKTRPQLLYANAIEKNYTQIRHCPKNLYGLSSTSNKNIANITGINGNDVYVSIENGWHYRFANKNKGNFPHCIDRISLNVYPDESLIRKLDDFITKTRVNVEYKTPASLQSWQTRHDPITMYFRESIPQDVKDDIIKIASPYVRNTKEEVLLGKKLANGIYQVAEPTEKDVLALISRAEKLGDDKLVACLKEPRNLLGAGLYHISTNTGKVRVKTSPGKIQAVEQLLTELENLSLHN